MAVYVMSMLVHVHGSTNDVDVDIDIMRLMYHVLHVTVIQLFILQDIILQT